MSLDAFEFRAAKGKPEVGLGLVVKVPQGTDDKRILMHIIASQLEFPHYFGFNWDALEECLGDLSWIQQPLVCMSHDDVPLSSHPEEARRYLKVLDSVVRNPGSVEIRVSFPETALQEIQTLLY